MQFKDLTQGTTINILDKRNVILYKGVVVSKGFPHLSNNKPEMVIDVTIDVKGKSALYEFPENASVAYANDCVITNEKETILAEIEALKRNAEQAIASVPQQEEIVRKTSALLEDMNPTFRERKANEARFEKIESSINSLTTAVDKLVNKLNTTIA